MEGPGHITVSDDVPIQTVSRVSCHGARGHQRVEARAAIASQRKRQQCEDLPYRRPTIRDPSARRTVPVEQRTAEESPDRVANSVANSRSMSDTVRRDESTQNDCHAHPPDADDDHPIVLDGLQRLFESQDDFEVVRCCSSADVTIDALRTTCGRPRARPADARRAA